MARARQRRQIHSSAVPPLWYGIQVCGLSLTALSLFVLYLATNSPLAALGVAGTLVPGCLLTSCERSQLIELERRVLGWRLIQPW